MVAEEMDGVTREQRKTLRAIEDGLEDVKKKLGRIWRHIETTDTAMADASDRIREHRDRQDRDHAPRVSMVGNLGKSLTARSLSTARDPQKRACDTPFANRRQIVH